MLLVLFKKKQILVLRLLKDYLKDITDRAAKNKSKCLLLDNELKKLKIFDVHYFEGRNCFEGGDGTQNMLVFQVKGEYFRRDNLGSAQYYTWKSKGTSDENVYYPGRR